MSVVHRASEDVQCRASPPRLDRLDDHAGDRLGRAAPARGEQVVDVREARELLRSVLLGETSLADGLSLSIHCKNKRNQSNDCNCRYTSRQNA